MHGRDNNLERRFHIHDHVMMVVSLDAGWKTLLARWLWNMHLDFVAKLGEAIVLSIGNASDSWPRQWLLD
jgi:hypothetical protein